MEILPAIIPESLEDMSIKLARVRGLVHAVQIDITDGFFAGLPSWPYTAGGKQEFARIISQEEGLPFWDSFYYEADLMIQNPEDHLDSFIRAGFGRIIVHAESTAKLSDIVTLAHEWDTEVGVALNIDTPLGVLDEVIEKLDVVQCMGIAEIGFQGEAFDPRVCEKIAALRQAHPDLIISVDGGVNLKTAATLVAVGADRLVSGSAIFKSEDVAQTINEFQTMHPVR